VDGVGCCQEDFSWRKCLKAWATATGSALTQLPKDDEDKKK
jgi:hypothetical protein